MRILITAIIVITNILYLNSISSYDERGYEIKDLIKNKRKELNLTKKEDTFLEKTQKIVKKIVKNVKSSISEDSVDLIEHKSHKIEKPEVSEIEFTIRQVLKEEGVEPFVIDLIVAQSKHESGNYKNTLTDYNNVFARHYFKADTFAISAGAPGEGHRKFAKYPSIEYATLSQLWYFRRKNYSMDWSSTYEFAAECKRKGYYEAPLKVYVAALNKYM